MTPLLVLALSAVSLGALVAGFWQLQSGAMTKAGVAERSGLDQEESGFVRLRRGLEERLATTDFGQRLADRLSAADAGITPLTFLVAAGGFGLAMAVVSDYALPKLMALLVGAICVRASWAWIDYKLGKRREAFLAQLPDVARLLSNASQAGLATRVGVEMAAKELEEPAATEMGFVAEDMRIGQSLDRALTKLERRLPSRDIGVLISTLVIQQRSGGDLVRALQEIADALDARRDLYREIKTVMAGSVATGYMVAGLGLAAIILLNLVFPGVIEEMTNSWPGRIALIVACGLYFLGYTLVRRLTSIEI